ncbi:hypothetical protein [Halodurantibacterium flavum]|uniref:Uncharacterized protein n=1 Tax=Halodurantibacterium flavum TaxID=1382802 RepID=A0ABW4S3I1_9RHOB
MFLKSITYAAALLAATTAFASDASATARSASQLEAQLGVPAGQFTTAELIQLGEARRENDAVGEQFILSGANRTQANSHVVSRGKAQLSSQLGVNPAEFTTSELIQLHVARRDNDAVTVEFILSGRNRQAEDLATVNRGKAQLAAQLGVDPTQYTTAELVQQLTRWED